MEVIEHIHQEYQVTESDQDSFNFFLKTFKTMKYPVLLGDETGIYGNTIAFIGLMLGIDEKVNIEEYVSHFGIPYNFETSKDWFQNVFMGEFPRFDSEWNTDTKQIIQETENLSENQKNYLQDMIDHFTHQMESDEYEHIHSYYDLKVWIRMNYLRMQFELQ